MTILNFFSNHIRNMKSKKREINEEKARKFEQMLVERIPFEEIVYHMTKENYEEVKKLIPKYMEIKNWLQNLIQCAAETRLFDFKLYYDLIQLTGKSEIMFSKYNYFPRYLFVKNYIKQSDFKCEIPQSNELRTIDEYENPIKENTLEYFISHDDVQSFVSLIATKDIDISGRYKINICGYKFSSIPEFVCYCGSLNILKYLIINNAKLTKITIRDSVLNGSEELIEFLYQKGYTFEDTLQYAVEYHHNKLAKWLFENFGHHKFRASYCVKNNNSEMLLYFLNYNYNDPNKTPPKSYPIDLQPSLCDNLATRLFLLQRMTST